MASQGWWEKSRTHQFLAAVLRFFVPSSLRATNAPVDGYVPSKATGEDLFTWVAPGGGGGIASVTENPGVTVDNTDPANPVVGANISTDTPNLIGLGTDDGLFAEDAPSDGTTYGRKDGAWFATGGGGSSVQSPGCVFSNGNLLLTGTLTSEIQVPYGGTIEAWTIAGDAAGDASIVVSHATYAAYDTMTTLFTATCTGSNKAQATGISHTLTAGDILRFSGSGFALFTRVSITLEVN